MKDLKCFCQCFSILFILTALASVVGSAVQDSVRIKNGIFVDSAGRQLIFRGVNAGNRSKLPPFYPFDPMPDFESALKKYADQIQALGFNVVRLLVIYEAVEPERGKYDEEYLKKYDAMVKAFAERGIYIIIDAHQDLYSRRHCGDGLPDWALPEKYRELPQRNADCQFWSLRYFSPPVQATADYFYSNTDGVLDSYASFFRMLAERYKDEPSVLGFEPINEPVPGFWGMSHYEEWYQKQLFPLYKKVAEAVQSVDPRYLIFAEFCPLENFGPWNKNRARPSINNLVFTPHYYDLGTFGIDLGKTLERWSMRMALKEDQSLARRWKTPMLVSEYGVSPILSNANSYINQIYSVLDELLLSGTFWEASMSRTIWNMENTSIFTPEGLLRDSVSALDRPYPRAVAGVVQKFSFDPQSRKLEMAWEENPMIKLPTEIYLPERIYGKNPKIELEPASEFKLEQDRHLLIIPSCERGGSRFLTIMP